MLSLVSRLSKTMGDCRSLGRNAMPRLSVALMKTLTRKRAWPGRLKETSEALARAGCYFRFVIANRIGGEMSRIIRRQC